MKGDGRHSEYFSVHKKVAHITYGVISYQNGQGSPPVEEGKLRIKTVRKATLGNHFASFYPLDAMRKRGLCCRCVSVCPSHVGIVSKQIKISNFFSAW